MGMVSYYIESVSKYTVRTRIIRPRARTSSPKFPPLDKGRKTHQKSAPLRQEKKRKTPNLTKRGKSNVLAQGPIIRVLTVIEYSRGDVEYSKRGCCRASNPTSVKLGIRH